MEANDIQIGRVVDTDTLDKALCNAAKDLGLKINSTPTYTKKFHLNSLSESNETYLGREYELRGRFFHAFRVIFFDRLTPGQVSEFNLYPTGVATEKKIKKYLTKVSEYLND